MFLTYTPLPTLYIRSRTKELSLLLYSVVHTNKYFTVSTRYREAEKSHVYFVQIYA